MPENKEIVLISPPVFFLLPVTGGYSEGCPVVISIPLNSILLQLPIVCVGSFKPRYIKRGKQLAKSREFSKGLIHFPLLPVARGSDPIAPFAH